MGEHWQRWDQISPFHFPLEESVPSSYGDNPREWRRRQPGDKIRAVFPRLMEREPNVQQKAADGIQRASMERIRRLWVGCGADRAAAGLPPHGEGLRGGTAHAWW
jgi:hypothetical protein